MIYIGETTTRGNEIVRNRITISESHVFTPAHCVAGLELSSLIVPYGARIVPMSLNRATPPSWCSQTTRPNCKSETKANNMSILNMEDQHPTEVKRRLVNRQEPGYVPETAGKVYGGGQLAYNQPGLDVLRKTTPNFQYLRMPASKKPKWMSP